MLTYMYLPSNQSSTLNMYGMLFVLVLFSECARYGGSQVMCNCVWLLEVLWLGEERGYWENTFTAIYTSTGALLRLHNITECSLPLSSKLVLAHACAYMYCFLQCAALWVYFRVVSKRSVHNIIEQKNFTIWKNHSAIDVITMEVGSYTLGEYRVSYPDPHLHCNGWITSPLHYKVFSQ